VAVPTTIDDDQLTRAFSALANATRRAIVVRLAEGEATVNELAAPFAMTLPAISKHIKVLEQAGLVRRAQRAQFRPCVLDSAALEQVSTWAQQTRRVWDERFDRMDDHLARLAKREMKRKGKTAR
jgi:DNA-binding transcriptional ArsR family regulator